MAHRNPDSPAWRLAKWSKALWQELLLEDEHLPEDSVEWQRSGSILLATSLAEAEQLRQREAMLGAAGVDAAMMSTEELRAEEPALGSAVCAGLLTRSDVQLVSLALTSLPLHNHTLERSGI
ncbi:hypothetical protein COCOBI_04-4410 [Coccomyxa sp. Obi]|nr:hypothetical protein COCOBI_04-4410 [Coccomyxa sp. Obi]